MSLAFITGTGLYRMACFARGEQRNVTTPYGEATLLEADYAGQTVWFLPRHGQNHRLPPHLINYRANISALVQLGVTEVLAVCSVGSLRLSLPPGSLVLMDQLIDMTWGRAHTTFSDVDAVFHIDFTEPYCLRFSQFVREAALKQGLDLPLGGTYICNPGPRLETAAEIRLFQSWQADVVGMTAVPEAQLAREAGLCYALLAVVANYGAGMAGKLAPGEISAATASYQGQVEQVITATVDAYIKPERNCDCAGSRVLDL